MHQQQMMEKMVILISMQRQVMFTKKKTETGRQSVISEAHKDHKAFKVVMDVKGSKDQQDVTDVTEQQDVTEETDAMEKMY